MDFGQIILILIRLVLGGAAAFFAIMLWSKTRDAVWTLIIIGVIVSYAEAVYSTLHFLIPAGDGIPAGGSVRIVPVLLSIFSTGFFAAALAVMVFRKYRR